MVVPSLDERLEAGAQRDLDAPANVEAEVIFAAAAASGDVDIGAIESGASYRIGTESHRRQLVHEIARERRNVHVAVNALKPELIVSCFRADPERREHRLVPNRQ